jgi:hypothetical protein
MKIAHKFSHYGPGGRNCPCCGPAPSFREKFDRMVKRRIKQFERKQIKNLLAELQ